VVEQLAPRSRISGSVTEHMNAPPARVWALIADVTRTGEWSPETHKAEWLDGATGPAVGARFRGRRRGARADRQHANDAAAHQAGRRGVIV
jgi:polyketide cyclase/dehydrase/lipid transport protein